MFFTMSSWSGSRSLASAALSLLDRHWNSSWICCFCPVSLTSCGSDVYNIQESPFQHRIFNFTALCSALGGNAASASCYAPHPKASAALRAWICTHSLTHSIFISCLQNQYYVVTHSRSVSSSKWSLPFHLLPPMKTISWVAAFLECESP